MKKLVIAKPKPPLGAQIGPVRIIEMRGRIRVGDPLRPCFSVKRVACDESILFRWTLDETIGYCHQNLIPIESIERLKAAPGEKANG